MAEYTIDANPRTIVGKNVKRLRKEGIIPITVYGPKIEPVSLQVPYRPLEVALMQAGGTNLIDIKIEGGKTHTVIARDVQRDVLRGEIIHADFFAVDATTRIRADIPVYLVGESPIVVARQGVLLTGTNNVTVETTPGKLRDSIEVDLSRLQEIGDSIMVADLDFGEGVTIINDPDEMLARVAQTSADRAEELEAMEEGLETEEEVTSAEPEVITKGKEDEEEDEE